MSKKIIVLTLLLQWTLFVSCPVLLAKDYKLSEEDDHFLDMVERKAFDYFNEEHHPRSGLVKDKASNVHRDSSTIASIASTGFGLAAMCVGAERGWISKGEAKRYCKKTLQFFLTHMQQNHGFFYHFVHWETGKKTNHTELSSIDTALFLAGALTAGEYFHGTEVEKLANELYDRVDFEWMLNKGMTLSMGWDPKQGFLKSRWDQYNESLILYFLAIGSATHPIPPESWRAVKKRIGIYGSHNFIYCPPLFTHQYSQIWLDLRNKNDGFADYFENSRIATLVNRRFCLDNQDKYKTYSENVWGLTASLGPNGYKAYGAPPGGAVHDGTVAPTAAGGSIVFTPRLSLKALKFMYQKFQDKIWGKYGFADAFNVDRDWYADEVIGIDQGPLVLAIENFRTQLIWKLFMQHSSVDRGMKRIGFRPGSIQPERPTRPLVAIKPLQKKVKIDGNLDDWDLSDPVEIEPSKHLELGEVKGPEDSSGKVYLRWSKKYLYLAARIRDDSLVMKKNGDKIWRDDCLELFFDPDENELKWESPDDIQLGLSPSEWENEGRSWAWFQGFDPSTRGFVKLRIRRTIQGYDLEAKISWKFLRLDPHPGLSFGFTPAIHDIDLDGTEGKLNWFFLPDGKTGNTVLGQAVLRSES